jgi:hypothetical protein
MLGRRPLSFPLIPCDLELEYILRQNRAQRNSNLPERLHIETMGEVNHMALQDYYLPPTPSCLRLPDVMTAHYEIKPSTIQSLPSFLGLSNENPYNFLIEFQTIYSTIKMVGITEDTLRMRLFPFSLKEKVKHWFQSLAPESITS